MVEGPHAIQPGEQAGDRARLRVVRRGGESPSSLDAPRLSIEIGALDLELGGRLEAVTVAYRTWGRLNAATGASPPGGRRTGAPDTPPLAPQAPPGDGLAAGRGGGGGPLIGSGGALDPDRAFVICANIRGGCRGTTGPAADDPLTGR